MLEYLNIPMVGNQHSGIDDCRNLVNIVKSMRSNGCIFSVNQVHLIDPRFIRDEDWICSYCNSHNFSLKEVCRKCKKELDSTSIRALPRHPVTPKPGDWSCPSCSELNFSYRWDCYSCGKKRPTDPQTPPDALPKTYPGDWKCIKCRVINFAHRFKCFKCGVGKPQ